MDKIDVAAKARLLSETSLCQGIDMESLLRIAGQMQSRAFVAGENLAESGEMVSEFWVVAEGEIDSFITDKRGRERPLAIIQQGETVGEVSILDDTPRPMRFTARTHGLLLVATAETFHDWLETYPSMMRKLFNTLSARFRQVVGLTNRIMPSLRLGIVASSKRAQRLTGRLVTRLLAAGERLQVWAEEPSQLRASGTWPESLPIGAIQSSDIPLLEPPSKNVDRRIVIRTLESDALLDLHRLRSCDEVLWLLDPKSATEASQNLRHASESKVELTSRVRVVWMLDNSHPVAPLDLADWDWKKPSLKVHVEEANGDQLTRLEQQGIGRIVRALRGVSIGIALAGGGAKGMAHLGVLRVLEEAGLSFDMMSGTSAGAMVGILYAAGMAPEAAIENFQRDLTPSRFVKMLPRWPNWYLISQYRNRSWESKLRQYLFDWRLEQLPIPFHAVTVDLVQARPVVRHQGDAVHAILESINLPIVSRPILRDGMVLVDGGILNNLPGDVLVDQGADFVVGVDVSKHIQYEVAGNRPDTPSDKMKSVGSIDTIFRIFESQAYNIGSIRNRAVDFWITPNTSGYGMADFHRIKEIAADGEVAALEKLPELKQRLLEVEQRLLGLTQNG